MITYSEGENIALSNQTVEVVACDECDHLMVNLDADQLRQGDLLILKRAGIRISNPETEKEICINCEFEKESFGKKLATWFDTDDDDDDSSFFSSGGGSTTPIFGGSSSFGGFGGFGGGVFSGGGASRSF